MFKNSIIDIYRRLLKIMPRAYVRKSVLLVALIFTNSFLDVLGIATLIPLLVLLLEPDAIEKNGWLSELYTFVSPESYAYFVAILCGTVFLVIVAKNIFSLLISRTQARFTFNLLEYFTFRAFQIFQLKDFLYFKKVNSATIVHRVRQVPLWLTSNVTTPMINLLSEAMILTIILIGILSYNYLVIVLISVTVVPVFIGFYRFAKKKIQHYGKVIGEIAPKMEKVLYHSIFGYVDVKINDTTDLFYNQYQGHTKEFTTAHKRLFIFNLIPTKIIEVSMALTVIVIVIYGTFLLEDTSGLVTLLAVFGIAAFRLIPSLNRMIQAIMRIRGGQHFLKMAEEVFLESDHIGDESSQVTLQFENRILLSNVSFQYPNSQEVALKDVTFEIGKGEAIGIVGRSGSGKTTLMNIFLRFLKEDSGMVMVDDTSLTDHHVRSWRNYIGYVQQDVYLLDGTIAENIAFGVHREEIDQNRLEEAIKMASLDDMVEELPNGLQSHVGERGTKFSGGQKQRIGIARALYWGAQILLFDEATSALDSQTEGEITESIRRLSENNLTIVVIAHRITSLKYCSRIVKLEKGAIVGIHSYDELLEKEISKEKVE